MEKDWFKSKACWSGIALIATAVVKAYGEFKAGSIDWATFVATASNGLGILGIRLAVK